MRITVVSLCVAMCCVLQGVAAAQQSKVALTSGWRIQSSEKVQAIGKTISSRSFHPADWYPASMPSTVLAALVANKVYPDPLFGMNLRSIPGASYPIGRNFSNLDMPEDSPFRASWWFRTTFATPAAARGKRLALHFDGINYRAKVWLNGRQIASSDTVAGMYRMYEFDVTNAVKAGATNVLAVEVFPPAAGDLAWTWVDWNPMPPDKNMGVWRPVYLTVSGDVLVRHPHVTSKLEAGFAHAAIATSVELQNLSQRAIHGSVEARTETVMSEAKVDLAPGETKIVRLPPFRLARPRLWWPAGMGPQNLYRMDVSFRSGGVVSDRQSVRYGIRDTVSEMTGQGNRLFRINGRPLLVRGGGWAPDMLLRVNTARQDAEFRYVRDMRLNTVRLEGKLEDDRFFDVADEQGILVLAGWCCCDAWEQWDKWKPENREIAAASQRDQVRRLRNHPSILAWMNGSDNPPPADIEKMYVDILNELDWPVPYVSSATAKETTVTGPTGMKMTGPYDWVPPAYWLQDDSRGGARGFNTETSPGPAVPPVESLRRMLPSDHLWPIDDVWNYHAGGGQFKTISRFTDALNARYGPASSVEDYAATSQIMTYEGERAMFEAYARNKFVATGVIQWMLNNAWPSLIWHLYDYYLRPGGGYFGTKKACEPVHVQYSYDDGTIVVVNGTDRAVTGKVVARVFDIDSSEKFSRDAPVTAAADAVQRLLTLPPISGISSTYFLDLRLFSAGGQLVSSNLYWLSNQPDELDWEKSTWYTTPVKTYADFTSLRKMPPARVSASMTIARATTRDEVRVTLTNPGKTIAFFVRLQVMKGRTGEEVLPVLWSDNYVTLLPGETRVVTATFSPADVGPSRPALVVTGWNVH